MVTLQRAGISRMSIITQVREIGEVITTDAFPGAEFSAQKPVTALDPDSPVLRVVTGRSREPLQAYLRASGGINTATWRHFDPAVQPIFRVQYHEKIPGMAGVQADPEVIRRRGGWGHCDWRGRRQDNAAKAGKSQQHGDTDGEGENVQGHLTQAGKLPDAQ